MKHSRDLRTGGDDGGAGGFFGALLQGLVRDLFRFVLAFAIGVGATAIVCWIYGIPLGFALIGGFVVLGIALALSSDSFFS